MIGQASGVDMVGEVDQGGLLVHAEGRGDELGVHDVHQVDAADHAGWEAAFVKDGQLQRFFVRGGNATAELQGQAVSDYIKHRFG